VKVCETCGQAVTPDNEKHILDLTEESWSLQHPLACRPDLLQCAVHAKVTDFFVQTELAPDRYYVEVNNLGQLDMEPIS
jgi:hypothetical protein